MEDFNSGTAMKCFEAMLQDMSTPLAHKASCVLKTRGLEGVLELRVNPAEYTCPQTLAEDLQLTSYFKKYEDLPFSNPEKRKAAAMKLFWASERVCFKTNQRLTPLLDDLGHYGERIESFLKLWRKKVRRILGKVPPWELIQGRFGNGATFDNKGNLTSVADKLTDYYSVTKIPRELVQDWDRSAWSRYAACGLQPMAVDIEDCDSLHAIRDLSIVRGSRFATVPKQWDKDRGICIEPSVNVFYQLGIGRLLSDRMRRAGLDKMKSQDHHKILARVASLTGSCATIDLSNASDTVCEQLIALILPHEWWTLLTSVRSTHVLVTGSDRKNAAGNDPWVQLEKFSSMGNGYTFELETLVFYTLALTVADMEGVNEDPYTPGLTISVYGDDIIVPSSIADSVINSLKFFGFEPNLAKTFTKGYFRESCGGDYLRGSDVRPFYLKENLNENHRYIAAANGIRRSRVRHATIKRCSLTDYNYLNKAWRILLSALPTAIRRHCFGPQILGDIVIHDENWERLKQSRTRNSIRYIRVWRPVMNRAIGTHHFRPGVVYAAKLYGDSQLNELTTGVGGKPVSPFVPKINGSFVAGYKLGWVPYS